ncbi:MAG: peptidase M28, partial [Acidobacteria bacterium]
MRAKLQLLLLTFGLAVNLWAQQPTANHFDGKTWWSHVKILADDKMEGRETGSEGLRKAEQYIVQQLTEAGLEPAGTNGYYQPVKFISRQIIEKESTAALVRNGAEEPLSLSEDAYFSTRVDLSPDEVKAPLVFVGYGLK